MRIKKLELHGFKSFKDRTVIHFDEGITGIVGPNGCGKSNIVDALVWVMGEMSAKHLRGASMEDVIFAGAEGYAPIGMAEVSLTLENDGGPFPVKYSKYSEVMITRRLHRSGESEYLINKEPARLRDIQEIFMDTGAGSKGFSIVEQGQIGKIITAKPEDRRTLIEEAAGITKFKARKRESQRKLESTDQNLVRLQDIIGEQKRQLDSLQRQAQRAERYRNLKREAQEKELWLSSRSYLQMHRDAEEAQKIFEEARDGEAGYAAGVSERDADLQVKRLELTEKEKAVDELNQRHGESLTRVQQLERDIRELQFEIEQARRTEQMSGSIRQQYTAREEALSRQQQELRTKHQESQGLSETLTGEFHEKNEKLQTIQSRIRQVDEELTSKRRQMLTLSQSESHVEARQLSLSEKQGEVNEKISSQQSVLLELENQKAEFEKRRTRIFNELEGERQMQLGIMQDVENFESNLTLLQGQVRDKQSEVERFKDELNQVTSRLYGLEDLQANFEGFEEGVKHVMLWQRQKQVPRADGSVDVEPEFFPVAEVVEVPAEYELAMEAALGSRLQMLLSSSGDTALGAVDYLKEQKQGRSSFISQEWIAPVAQSQDSDLRALLNKEEGVRAWLVDLVQVPEGFKDAIHRLLSGVVIVENLRTALRLRAQQLGLTFVTVEGDTLTSDGVLTGGSSEQAESGVLKRRREIKELSQKREEWAGKLSLAQASLKKIEAQAKQMAEELENSRRLQNEKELQIVSLKKDLQQAETELGNALRACDRQKTDLNREQALLLQIDSDLSDLNSKLEDLRSQRLEMESQVAALTEEFDQSRGGVDELQREVTRLQVESTSKTKEAEGYRHQLDMVEKSLHEVRDQLGRMTEESEKTVAALTENQLLIEERKVQFESLVRENEAMAKELALARDAYEQLDEVVRAQESELSQSQAGLNALKARMNEAQLKSEQLKMKVQYLRDQIFERYHVELAEVAPQYEQQEGDAAVFETDLQELKEKLGKIGEVNLSAIQEYDELISRYEFLNKQFQDLTDAKEQLRKVIDRINRICSKRFKETFDLVNERFMKVFPVLFGGGEARLILVEDPEKGEMGIDIVSRPPGKKLQNVSLLSGGEKALTAVSLIFSIFLVKPSPFCLLDEVDAPLDDANVARFNDLVKEMAKRSQIIVVTHNKHTMRVNNKLYGVTMQEKGVSKMVSVSLAEAQRVATA